MKLTAAPAAAATQAVRSEALARVERWVQRAQAGIALRWGLLATELFLAGAITGLALWGLADLLFAPAPETHRIIRAVYLLAALGGFGALLALVLAKIPSRSALALRLEGAEPTFKGSLLAAIEALERPGAVPGAVAELSAERALRVLEHTGAAPAHTRLPWAPANFWFLGAMAFTLSAAVFFGPDFFRAFMRGLFPFEAVESALALRFERVRPGRAAAIEGDVLPVEALLDGSQAGAVFVQVREAGAEGPAPAESALFKSVVDGREVWRGSLGVLRRDSVYRLIAYDAEDLASRKHPRVVATPWYEVKVRPGAGVQRLAVLVESPGYSGYPPQWHTDPDTVQALAHAQVTVLVAAGPAGDLGEGTAELPGGARVALERLYDKEGLTFYRTSFSVQRSGLARIELAPADAQHAGAQAVFALSVVQDLPPSADAAISAGASPDLQGLPIELRLNDDIGLTGAKLVLSPLPPEDGRTETGLAAELSYEIPLPPGRREFSERLIVPAKGLEAWLTTGFQYQVVVYDGAQPEAQRGRSPWRKWQPDRSARTRNEAPGMLDGTGRKPARSLLRPNALGKIPDLTSDEAAKLENPGAGRPKELQRPNADRLEGGKLNQDQPAGGGGKGGTQQQGSKAGKQGEAGDRYEKPQGLGGNQSQPQPQPGPQGEQRGQGKGEGETGPLGKGQENGKDEPAGKGQPGAEGPEADGKPGERNDGKTIGTKPGGKTAGGPGSREGGQQAGGAGGEVGPDGGGGDGVPDAEGEPDPNDVGGQGAGGEQTGQGGQSGRDGQGGAGGTKKRDGGLKSGRETGTGNARMAPPDLQTLARMKGISEDEARAYAQKQGLTQARTDFGTAKSDEEKRAASARSETYKTFDNTTVGGGAAPRKKPEPPAGSGAPAARLDRVDPAYVPMVQGYFQRLRNLSSGGPAGEEPAGK